MMRIGNMLICLLMVLSGFSCRSPINIVETEAESGFSLGQYQTYNFYDEVEGGDPAEVMPQYLEEMNLIKAEIAQQLEQRGLSRSPQPDLLVNIGAVVEEKVQTRETNIRDAPIYIGQRRYHWQVEEREVSRYQQGTVSLHLIDRDENRLMWRGVAEGVIPKDREKRLNRIETGVKELFDKVPAAD